MMPNETPGRKVALELLDDLIEREVIFSRINKSPRLDVLEPGRRPIAIAIAKGAIEMVAGHARRLKKDHTYWARIPVDMQPKVERYIKARKRNNDA